MDYTLQGLIEWGKSIPAVYIEYGNLSNRSVPYEHMLLQRSLINHFNMKTMIEIGSSRGPLRHDLYDHGDAYSCCNDGHSTHHWYETNCTVYSVDIDLKMRHLPQRDGMIYYHCDGIDFLRHFSSTIDFTIDFLYLDAWDVIPDIPYAEKHLEAFEAIMPKLSAINMVSIDDTDSMEGGKGRLLMPRLFELGYTQIAWGRQSVFLRVPV